MDKTMPKFLVNVRCWTFNQAKYITDSMNGFCMQQTNFPFVCCIVDDASTDGEQNVIEKYLLDNFDFSENSEAYKKETEYGFITYARHKNNRNCYFVVIFLKKNHFSKKKNKLPYLEEWRKPCKYEAICEGDDYWIDSLKLQKQVDAIESHVGATMVYTAFDTVNEENKKIFRYNYEYNMKHSFSGFLFPNLMFGNFVMTLSCLCRKEILDSDFFRNTKPYLDYNYFLCAAALGVCIYLPDVTCCYRKVSTSLMNSHGKSVSIEYLKVWNSYVDYFFQKQISFSFYKNFLVKTYIVAKGINMGIKGYGFSCLTKSLSKKRMYLYIIPALFLELKYLYSFNFKRLFAEK